MCPVSTIPVDLSKAVGTLRALKTVDEATSMAQIRRPSACVGCPLNLQPQAEGWGGLGGGPPGEAIRAIFIAFGLFLTPSFAKVS